MSDFTAKRAPVSGTVREPCGARGGDCQEPRTGLEGISTDGGGCGTAGYAENIENRGND